MKLRYPFFAVIIGIVLWNTSVKESKVIESDSYGNKTYLVTEVELIGSDTLSVQKCYDKNLDICEEISK